MMQERASASRVDPSVGFAPTCMSTIWPGTAASSTRWHTVFASRVPPSSPFQPSVSTDHLNGIVFGDRLSGRVRRKLNQQADELAHLYPADWPVTPRHRSADEA